VDQKQWDLKLIGINLLVKNNLYFNYFYMKLEIESPLDMHLHLRDEKMLKCVAPLSAKYFSWALIMPNLIPPIKTLKDVKSYKKRIKKAIDKEIFTPYMTIFFHEELNYEILKELKPKIIAIKMYPDWVTTNSEWWVKIIDLKKIWHIFESMEKLKIPLCIHWETNDFVMDREKNFIPIYEMLAKTYKNLKIIMEHITTKESAIFVEKFENVFATITLHHLYITLDDIAWWMLQPHLFCKPIAKRPEDKEALLNLALSWNKKVMFWSDSAPHPIHKKETKYCSAGIFTAPIVLQCLAELFEQNWKLKNLEHFISKNAQNIYWIKPKKKIIILEKKDFVIPELYWDIVPFKHWKTISWSIRG